jgi:hypothetical protein
MIVRLVGGVRCASAANFSGTPGLSLGLWTGTLAIVLAGKAHAAFAILRLREVRAEVACFSSTSARRAHRATLAAQPNQRVPPKRAAVRSGRVRRVMPLHRAKPCRLLRLLRLHSGRHPTQTL